MTMYVGGGGGGGTGNVGTHYEQLIAKLMESGGDPSKYLKHLQHVGQYDNVCGWRGWGWDW